MGENAEAVAANLTSRRNVTIEITNLTNNYCLINPKVFLDRVVLLSHPTNSATSQNRDCNEALFKKMYYDKEPKDFVRMEANGSGITYEGRYLDIKATMSPLGRSIMKDFPGPIVGPSLLRNNISESECGSTILEELVVQTGVEVASGEGGVYVVWIHA
ncbi:hypothetical protein WMY93_010739 [Mugilogobius chulae]|uniref:Uncharacterized protein n=1 Tax=Mugilogobius chulae TaxID=88201 RepID=A0AAW0P869_9GOBI